MWLSKKGHKNHKMSFPQKAKQKNVGHCTNVHCIIIIIQKLIELRNGEKYGGYILQAFFAISG